MRITLDIDDNLLDAARKIARLEHKDTGQVVSELMRTGLAAAHGLQPFLPGNVLASNDQVNRLREDLGI